jgi:hypothetical protein
VFFLNATANFCTELLFGALNGLDWRELMAEALLVLGALMASWGFVRLAREKALTLH